MKKVLIIVSLLVISSLSSFASSRSDVQILEATENIRYLGQKISKEYLLFYYTPKKIELKEKLLEDIKLIDSSIHDISLSTIDIDSKNILDFLSYNKDEIKEILTQKVSKENSILMLDYSESFLEGANSIASGHKYQFSDEEKMLMAMKEFEYLLERVSKYYIASTLNLDKLNNYEHMKEGILKIDVIVKEINNYAYSKELKNEVAEMNKIWKRDKEFFFKAQTLFVPTLLETASENLENIIDKLALYHKKNQ